MLGVQYEGAMRSRLILLFSVLTLGAGLIVVLKAQSYRTMNPSTLGSKLGAAGTEIVYVYDDVPVTGISQFQIRLGAGQGSVAPWVLFDNAENALSQVSSNGDFVTGQQRGVAFYNTPANAKFYLYLTGAEGGGDTGSDFTLNRYGDGGAFLGIPLLVKRVDGFVGINQSSPQHQLDVGGQMRLADNEGVQPACAVATRFTFWVTAGGAGVKDKVEVCAKDGGDAYAWRTIY